MFFLIGHRGVGKTTLISKIDRSVDLDQEILKNHNIDSFFENGNEQGFRELERETLQKIIDQNNVDLVALGAGFELSKFSFPLNSKFIWIQRRSDLTGRIFFDRPQLSPKKNSDINPIDDYFSRFEDRQRLYEETASVSLEMSEGAPIEDALVVLLKWIKGESIKSPKAYYTINKIDDLKYFSGKIELRTDLLNEEEILSILESPSQNEYLVAVRTSVVSNFLKQVVKNTTCLIDVPFENQNLLEDFTHIYDFNKRFIISSHESMTASEMTYCLSKGLHLKWAPVIQSFSDLKASFKVVDGRDVSFLPRSHSNDAKWKWVRESLFYKNKINFYRSGLTEHLDQITVQDLEVLEPVFQECKGAVLGSDVFLSRSPGYHRKFFAENYSSVYSSIPLERDEFIMYNLDFIKSFGYKALSVTSPFKNSLDFLGCNHALNTVFLGEEGENHFTDTDEKGLTAICDDLKDYKRPLIWGSGSMGKALNSILGSRSELMSVRESDQSELEGFDALIWCAGPEAEAPPLKEAPLCIFDLEYKEHSRAKRVAFELRTQYISGEKFFERQASAQQVFWLKKSEEAQ